MKLSDYAKKYSVTYRTAYNHWKRGYLEGEQLPSGTIIIYGIKDKYKKEKSEYDNNT